MAVVYGDNTASFGKTAMLKACYIKWGTAMPRLLTPASCHDHRPLPRGAPIATEVHFATLK